MTLLNDESRLEDITPIFQDVFQDDHLIIHASTSRHDIEAWDSMNHLNLLMALEQRYRIKFSLTEIEAIQTVDDILELIQRKTVPA